VLHLVVVEAAQRGELAGSERKELLGRQVKAEACLSQQELPENLGS
jgi:hypothetical protein